MKQPVARAHEPHACDASLSRAFEVLGKRWNGMILGTLGQRAASFSDLKRALGIGDSTLADRLAELVRVGLVARRVDEGPPITVAYELTDAGGAVMPALRALMRWSRDNLTEEGCAKQGP